MAGNLTLAKKIFKHGSAFVDSAYFCHVEVKSKHFVRTQYLGIPDIMNSAFACEVLFKSLLHFYGVPESTIKNCGHHLKKLWDTLCNTDNLFETDCIDFMLNIHGVDDIISRLQIVDNNFPEARYIYESNNMETDRTFLVYFSIGLRDYCCRKYYGSSWVDFVNAGFHWDS